MLRNMRRGIVAILGGALIVAVGTANAWTGPTGSPPNNNVPAPVNVGGTAQTKSGDLLINAAFGTNALAVFGNSLLQASSYLNWGATAGTNGYGIRDNGGAMEFKNSGGVAGDNGWQTLQAIVSGLIGGGAGSWVLSGNNLYNTNSGNIGIGTTNPVGHASSRKALILSDTSNDALMEIWGTNSGKSIFQQVGGNTYVGNLASASGGDLYLTYGNGATGVFVKGTTGNVGIGTVSPTAKLTVMGSGDFASVVPTLNLLGTGDGAQYAAFNLSAGTSGTTNTWGIQYLQNGNLTLGYYPSGAPTMQLTQSSNVGIGMTPSNKLDVAGNIGMTGSDFYMGGTDVLRRDGSNAYIFPWGTGYGGNTVFLGGGTNTSLWVTGDVYVASRGLNVSQLASKVGAQFWQSGATCPSGSLVAGFTSASVLCQWI